MMNVRNFLFFNLKIFFEAIFGYDGSAGSSRHASVSTPVRPSMRTNRAQSLPMLIEVFLIYYL